MTGTCLLLGCAVSFSPCPFTTNVLAIGYVAKELGGGKGALLSTALLYTLGRVLAYGMLALVLALGLEQAPAMSYWLQETLPLYMGPLMVLAGLAVLGILPLPGVGAAPGKGVADRLGKFGMMGALPLGMLFALVMCPPSAAAFFGGVLPLTLTSTPADAVAGICLFGVGTALPALVLAPFTLMNRSRKLMKHLPRLQRGVTLLTGWGFLLFGAYQIITLLLLD